MKTLICLMCLSLLGFIKCFGLGSAGDIKVSFLRNSVPSIDALVTHEPTLSILRRNASDPKALERQFSQEEKDQLIQALHDLNEAQVKDPDSKIMTGIPQILANLGDRKTMEDTYKYYTTGRGGRTQRNMQFYAIRHPDFLAVLAKDLMDPPSGPIRSTQLDILPVPLINVSGFLYIIGYSGYFQEDAVAWADSIQGGPHRYQRPLPHAVEVMQEFWRLNGESIKRGEYDNMILPEIPSDAQPIPKGPEAGLDQEGLPDGDFDERPADNERRSDSEGFEGVEVDQSKKTEEGRGTPLTMILFLSVAAVFGSVFMLFRRNRKG